MYTDEEEKRSFPIRTFLISLLLIIIFVLLLVWLLPMPNLKGLNNRIFNANVQEMKNAAIPYFTTDKLPQEIGDEVKLTLQEMLDLKLLLPFTDKNGETCDTKNSYVTLTKKKDYYEMKINLKCNGEEDYIIVKLGCYSYCTSAVCEEDKPNPTPTPTPTETGPSCVLYVANGTAGENGWYLSDAVVKFKSKTAGKGATITGYGLGTGGVNYNKNDSYTVTKNGSTTVYGYVKDSNGKTAVCSIIVKKDNVKPSCDLGVLAGVKGNNRSYTSDVIVGFTSRTDKESGVSAYGITNSSTPTYNNKTRYTINTNGNHKVYGYIKDYAGNTAVCDITINRNAEHKDSNPNCTLEIAEGTLGANGWYLGNVNVRFASKTTTNGATITGFGIGFSETYAGNNTYLVTKDGTSTLYGYVKDSNDNKATCSIVVKKDQTKPSCSLTVLNGTLGGDNFYTSDVTIGFSSRVDSASGIQSFGLGKSKTYAGNKTYLVNTIGKHTIYGYVKDYAGNEAECSITVEKRNKIEYQYKKDISAQYSAWSDYTTTTYNPANPPQFGKYPLLEIEDLGKTQEVDYYKYTKGDAIYKNEIVKVGTITESYCKDYDYYRITTTTGSTTYAVSKGAGWRYVGRVTTTGYPTDTLAVKYEFVGEDWSDCGTGCSRTSTKVWNKYVRDAYKADGSNTLVTSTGVEVKCGEVEQKQVEIFANAKALVGYAEVRTPVYKDVYKYRYRKRTLIKNAYTDYKWSIYNDKTLLDQGYVMTGNTRVVE